MLKTSKNSPICTILPLTTKRLEDVFWFHIDLEEVNSTVLVEQLKVVSKIRIMREDIIQAMNLFKYWIAAII